METLTDQNWLLSVGTFLPLVGVLVRLRVPTQHETLHKEMALTTALATLGVMVYTLVQFDEETMFLYHLPNMAAAPLAPPPPPRPLPPLRRASSGLWTQ